MRTKNGLTDSSNDLRHGEFGLRVLSRSESDHETKSKHVENETDADERLEVSSVSEVDNRKSAQSSIVTSMRREKETDRTRIPVAAQVRILEKMLRPRIRVADSTDWFAAMDTVSEESVQF